MKTPTIRVRKLLAAMSPREKLGQMTQLSPEFFIPHPETHSTGPLQSLGIQAEDLPRIGSVLNAFRPSVLRELQVRHLEEDPHQIPLLFMADVIHGARTVYPIPLALASSFNPQLLAKASALAAGETRQLGIRVTFAPMADLVRDPRWGRVMESSGEDPYLNRVMSRASVQGFHQGWASKEQALRLPRPGLASCVKHFAAYGAAEAGREYNTVELSRLTLQQAYLEGYRGALEAGAELVMTAFNTFEQVPCTGNAYLMRQVLREQLGFDGVLITDYAAVAELIHHGVAADGREAARLALDAGVDIEMMSANFINYGEGLLEQGALSLARLDESVARILTLKEDLGLFDDPWSGIPEAVSDQQVFAGFNQGERGKSSRATALEAAAGSMVLLQKGRALPLPPQTRLGLAGPFASTPDILGGWSLSAGADTVTVADGLRQEMAAGQLAALSLGLDGMDPDQPLAGPGLTAGFAQTPTIYAARVTDAQLLTQAQACFADCDIVLLTLGERQELTGEGSSKTDLNLTPYQLQLLRVLGQLGKPLVAVVFSGRPLLLQTVAQTCDSLVQAWFPGCQGGLALAQLLTGQRDFSGRLPISFPLAVGQLPLYYNQLNTGRPYEPDQGETRFVSRYLDQGNDPLYPFGFGLSYYRPELHDLRLERMSAARDLKDLAQQTPADTACLKVTVNVLNPHQRAATETVQLYIRDLVARVSRPVRELKRFTQLTIPAGSQQMLSFILTRADLAYYDSNLQQRVDDGEFDIMVGTSSADHLSQRIHLTF
ncbi:beta-glucosidase [Oscillospiraceae bacterium HV4-5-C5C]|nr:beta-glucosidase [Oscillospiraceae bacterium HV4-5-C5C]